MKHPLVSVICISYNHENFVEAAVKSVIDQTYSNIEIIIIDDASTDNSPEIIARIVQNYPQIKFIKNSENLGNCKSFNKGLTVAKGKYIIDLAADDILLPNRITSGLNTFESNDHTYGVNYTNAELIDENSIIIDHHFKTNSNGDAKHKPPEGDIFKDLIARYIVCTPTMMIKKEVLDYLGGYDEDLFYEDFDFWVRSSRKYKYCYTDKLLVQKRILQKSLSGKQLEFKNNHLKSTLKVCEKIDQLITSSDEQKNIC